MSVAPGSVITTPPPRAVIDEASRRPLLGTYRGSFSHVDLGALRPSGLRGVMSEKRWIYAMIVREPWLFALAIVDLGYAQTAFGFAYHENVGLRADLRSVPGLPLLSGLRQDGVHRVDARLVSPLGRFSIRERRGEGLLEVRTSARDLELRASLALSSAAPAMTAVAPVRGGIVNVTEKRALAPVRGAALVRGERVDLDGGIGGFDLTIGLLARETRWNWAFLMGATDTGEPIALNLVEGFVGAPECSLFGRESLHALSEGRFEMDRATPRAPWRVRTAEGECDLTFEPGDLHEERLDLGALRSRFIQPIGAFRGTVRRADETLRIAHALGVVEDQDVRW
ncbi:MAG: hypothetical protein OHK0013_32400 [Sandaracinaceae bacterium]